MKRLAVASEVTFFGMVVRPTCSVIVVNLCLFLFYYSGDVWPDFILYTGGLASLLVFLLFYESFLAKFVAVSECHVSYFAYPFLCHCGRVWVFRALLLVGVCPFLNYCQWVCALSWVIACRCVPFLALLLIRRTCFHAFWKIETSFSWQVKTYKRLHVLKVD